MSVMVGNLDGLQTVCKNTKIETSTTGLILGHSNKRWLPQLANFSQYKNGCNLLKNNT